MPSYNFKQNCTVWLVTGGISRYKLEVTPDLSFSQTFDLKSSSVKTLHDQNAMFESVIINKANPLDFSFTVYLTTGANFDVLGDWLTQRNPYTTGSDEALFSYDIYVDTGVEIFKLEKCVAERGTFQISRNALITVSLSGTGSKLSLFGPAGTAIPGTVQARDFLPTYIIPRTMRIDLNSVELTGLSSVTLELSNDVSWIEYDTLHKSLYVTSASDSQYPEAFVVSRKTLSGTIVQYLTDANMATAQKWSTNSTLRIRAGDLGAYFLDVNMPTVAYTNRVSPDDLFTQTFDFRMTSNPSNISDVLNYKL